MRSAEEIRNHFLDLVNHSLSRLEMYGGEVAAQHFLSELAFIDERDSEFDGHMETLRSRGTFGSLGVKGSFSHCTRNRVSGHDIASIYAEIAFAMGYLKTDRILTEQEFDCLQTGLREKCRARNFTTEEILGEFGIPSWQSGAGPHRPCTFLYLCSEVADGAIAFDFWNGIHYDEKRLKMSGQYGELPVLRDVRIRAKTFGRDFTFTPIGRKITKRA